MPRPAGVAGQGPEGCRIGDQLELLATDPGSKSDVPSWAEISGNELLESDEPTPGQYRYLVRKV